MNVILLFDRIKNKIFRLYREYVFKKKTGYKIHLMENVRLINTNLKIGKNVRLYPDVMFFGDGLIDIDDNVTIGYGTIIYASKSGGVSIGANTLVAAQCYIIDCNHGIQKDKLIREQMNDVEKVIIGEDCWLGTDVTVLKGSQIGNGAVIGAKAVVWGGSPIPDNAVAMGIPAVTTKYRES